MSDKIKKTETPVEATVEAQLRAEFAKELERARQEMTEEFSKKIAAVQAEKPAAAARADKKSADEDKSADKKYKSMLDKMDKAFGKQKRVKIRIPVDTLNPKDTTVFAQINGYTFTMKRGCDIEVPEAIEKLLKKAGKI